MERKHAWGALLALGFAAAGCVGGTAPGVSSDELLLGEGQLGSLQEDQWQSADAGCEGQIDGTVHFAIASAEFGLIAVVEADGDVLCVDTVTAVEEELEEAGLDDEADDLVTAFHAALREREAPGMRLSGTRAGDPDPEPNLGFRRIELRGDPDPEPNSAP